MLRTTSVIITLYLFAFIIQSTLLLHWDVSWYFHVSEKFLAGEKYVKDFFEINPPLVLYLYIPPVILNKLLGLNIVDSVRSTVFLFSTASLFCCYRLMRKLLQENHRTISLLMISIAFVFLILPLNNLGQREHFLIILTMPYFFLMACRINNDAITLPYAFLIGLFAGLGFAIKPYYLIVPFLMELYYHFAR